MSKRTLPENDDWTRRYLRRLNIPCEGEQLQGALDSLDGPTWQRLKNAWRQRTVRTEGPMQQLVNHVFNQGRRFGSVWERLIAWGVISEEDARLLASQEVGSGRRTLFDDAGAKICLELALSTQVEVVRQSKEKPNDRLHGALISFIVVCAGDGDLAQLDDRVVKSMEGSPFTPEQIRAALAELKELGYYDEAVRRGLEKPSTQQAEPAPAKKKRK
jgi:hypothetical protein